MSSVHNASLSVQFSADTHPVRCDDTVQKLVVLPTSRRYCLRLQGEAMPPARILLYCKQERLKETTTDKGTDFDKKGVRCRRISREQLFNQWPSILNYLFMAFFSPSIQI
ncbi:uncharacterized protein LOC111871353 isoform X3 [Cryptotermes secundus]|uniref:uncharacterized protein LOC111871353 isoform X3 n=1 Tax=Cryptotermes secundus TaxID=105785 RepID=UPI001454E42C|nr:uncharacterized protein LOC111871353 isoform X3 [Cryptotermes secundus]